jgi:hypothetical protein
MADFGIDINTVVNGELDLDPFFREVTGTKAVVQSVIRNWFSSEGTAFDLTNLMNWDWQTRDLATLATLLEDAALADDRLSSCDVTVEGTVSSEDLTIKANVVVIDGTSSRFVLNVSGVTLELLELA